MVPRARGVPLRVYHVKVADDAALELCQASAPECYRMRYLDLQIQEWTCYGAIIIKEGPCHVENQVF